MGLLDLPAPLFGVVDQFLASFLPASLRLILWSILAGWLTMVLYRRLSRQETLGALKTEQKRQQERIAGFDGDFSELMPVVRRALSLGFRQLGLSIGPALLATVPVLFLVVWVAERFAYATPEPGEIVKVIAEPERGELAWRPASAVTPTEDGWALAWPLAGDAVDLTLDGATLLSLSPEHPAPLIHQRRWWNVLIANPAGYLPEGIPTEVVRLELPERRFLAFGPEWMRGWMFTFFASFLAASLAFKVLLKID